MMYEGFTDRARKVMWLANEEAQRFNHEYIGTEHVLLGLIAEGQGIAANVLKNLDIELIKVRREVESIVLQGPPITYSMEKLPLTPRAKKVIEYAIEAARNLNHDYVGTEHLLLGLLREQEGVAAQVLMNLGLRLEDICAEILKLLGRSTIDSKAPLAHSTVESKGPPVDRAADIQHLPGPARAIAEEFGRQIEFVRRAMEEAVAEMEFDKAASLLDLSDKLKKQRDEFIRQWPKDL